MELTHMTELTIWKGMHLQPRSKYNTQQNGLYKQLEDNQQSLLELLQIVEVT